MTTIQARRAAPAETVQCLHRPRCPGATARDRGAARIIARHPEQGWGLLCNGVVIFDDGGMLLPDGQALAPPQARTSLPAAAA
jgi:hypothetical protein